MLRLAKVIKMVDLKAVIKKYGLAKFSSLMDELIFYDVHEDISWTELIEILLNEGDAKDSVNHLVDLILLKAGKSELRGKG